MPELPEVETTRKGISTHLIGATISDVVVRNHTLRYPITPQLKSNLTGQALTELSRRGKYLLFKFPNGTLILHLGMSGVLRVLPQHTAIGKHDHMDLIFENKKVLRFTDPRRFGCAVWTTEPPENHSLLAKLGHEPLSKHFNSDYLFEILKKRKTNIKSLIMDSKVVVGVGNIYASEALYDARINPKVSSNRISRIRCELLVDSIKTILRQAIKQGGTTIKDFTSAEGKPGYFAQNLKVYGRENKECFSCGNTIKHLVQAQRSSYYCPTCQR